MNKSYQTYSKNIILLVPTLVIVSILLLTPKNGLSNDSKYLSEPKHPIEISILKPHSLDEEETNFHLKSFQRIFFQNEGKVYAGKVNKNIAARLTQVDDSKAKVEVTHSLEHRKTAKERGIVLDDIPPKQLVPGLYNYVITDKGHVSFGKVFNSIEYGVKHYLLGNNRKIVAAGELMVDNNGNHTFNLASGTYIKKVQRHSVENGEINYDQSLAIKVKAYFEELNNDGKPVTIHQGTGEARKLATPQFPSPAEARTICDGDRDFNQRNPEICK